MPVDLWLFPFEVFVCFLPDGKCAREEFAALLSEDQDAAATVLGVAGDFHKATALEWLERGGERGAIHGEQGSDWTHRRRFGTVERHEQRKLPVGEIKWPKCIVEAPGENSRGTLHVQTETMVADQESCLVR